MLLMLLLLLLRQKAINTARLDVSLSVSLSVCLFVLLKCIATVLSRTVSKRRHQQRKALQSRGSRTFLSFHSFSTATALISQTLPEDAFGRVCLFNQQSALTSKLAPLLEKP
ncbi:MAG: hypothetical protein QWI73_03190 [Alphaproteobacteria bacterium]|nr:hypothetical protein [Alphaproteobacteria bacterium]